MSDGRRSIANMAIGIEDLVTSFKSEPFPYRSVQAQVRRRSSERMAETKMRTFVPYVGDADAEPGSPVVPCIACRGGVAVPWVLPTCYWRCCKISLYKCEQCGASWLP